MTYDFSNVPDDELYQLALEKQKNGNASPRAYAAQCEIARRKAPYKSRHYRNGSSKRYAHNHVSLLVVAVLSCHVNPDVCVLFGWL